MADEFEQYRVNEPSEASPQDEFEQYRVQEGEPKESFAASLGYAIPRIYSDVADKAYSAVQSIPGYLEKAKTEVPGFLIPGGGASRHPIHSLGQGLAGANEAINSLAQFPLNVSRYGSDRLHLIPEAVTNALQKITPEDTTEAINHLFGDPKYAGESLLRGMVRNALPLTGAARLAQAAPHLTQRGASRALRDARQQAGARNIGTLNVDPALIEDTRQFLPNTLPNRNAIDAAQYGDYNSLFKLQSDVGKSAGDYAKSKFSAAERAHGKAGLEARNRLLDAIHENLQIQGHGDISDLLRQGQKDYSRYMKFKPYRNWLALGALGLAIPKGQFVNALRNILRSGIE